MPRTMNVVCRPTEITNIRNDTSEQSYRKFGRAALWALLDWSVLPSCALLKFDSTGFLRNHSDSGGESNAMSEQ